MDAMENKEAATKSKRPDHIGAAAYISFFVIVVLMVAIFAAGKKTTLANNIYICEICPLNNTIISNTEGHYYDYIELYNPTENTIELFGYRLSDSENILDKYRLPDDFIAPGERKLIWIDNGLTGFSLSGGEKLFLSDENGNIIDRVGIPFIEADKVYSREADSEKWHIADAKDKSAVTILDINGKVSADVPAPTASKQSGFFDEPFDLELTAAEGYTIYYTLDSTQPNRRSEVYTKPIHISDRSSEPNEFSAIKNTSAKNKYIPDYNVNKATVLRAVAISEDGKRSYETCHTYFVGYADKNGYCQLPTVSLVTDPDNLFSTWRGIYVVGNFWDELKNIKKYRVYTVPVNYRMHSAAWKRPAVVEYIGQGGNVISCDEVIIGMHGNWSLTYLQKSFNITGEKPLFDDIFGYQEKKLVLRSGGNDYGKSKIRDVLNQRLVRDRSLRVQDAVQTQVFLDGEYWGVYFIQERISKEFIANRYGVDPDDLVIMSIKKVVDGPDEDALYYSELLDFAAKHDLADEAAYEQISQMMDIQSFIDYIATEEYTGNCDSLQNNYAMWRTKEKENNAYGDRKWRWILVDTDHTAGFDKNSLADTNTFRLKKAPNASLYDEPLFKALIKNENFKKQFIVSFMDMANYNFEYKRVEKEIYSLVNNMSESVIESHRRFIKSDYSKGDYDSEIGIVKSYYADRFGYITDYLGAEFGLTGKKQRIVLDLTDAGENQVRVNTSVLGFDRGKIGAEYYSDYPVALKAMPAAGNEFVGWNINGEMRYGAELEIIPDGESEICPVFDRRAGR